MRAFMVLALVAFVNARPEAGYNYQRPSGGSFGQSSNIGSVSFQPSIAPSISTGGSFISGQSFQPSIEATSSGASFVGQSVGQSFGHGQSFGVASGGGGSFIGQGFQQNLAPIIQKHIYVHVPPPEPVEEHRQFIQQATAPRKNYKIIFIKAPTAPSVSQQVIQQQQQVQEKTIVYVLVKKPDEQEALQLAGFAPTKPTKPEVYFIKYKTQKDGGAGGLVSSGGSLGGGIVSGGGSLGGGSLGGGSIGIGGGSLGGGSIGIGGGSLGGGSIGIGGGSLGGGSISIGSSSSASGSSGSFVSGPSAAYGTPGGSGPY